MYIIDVPGYEFFFGSTTKSYEEWVEDIPSEVIISVFIMLNSELNTPEDDEEKQLRLWQLVSEDFTIQHRKRFENALLKASVRRGRFTPVIFARRYCLAIITKELIRDYKGSDLNTSPDQEFRIILAYLRVIDEIHKQQNKTWSKIFEVRDEYSEYRMIWPTFIDQIEFSHEVNAGFEYIKLLCFCKYSFDHLRPYLKQYLKKIGFKNLSGFLASCNQIIQGGLQYHPERLYRKFTFIQPTPFADISHLDALSINHLCGTNSVSLFDLRKYPLYKDSSGNFLALDEDLARRKIYKGPFFEIRDQTELKSIKSFNAHSSDVSKEAMENICFRAICHLLKSKKDVLYFDNKSDSQPDGYRRRKDVVMLVECKDNILNDKLIAQPDFEAIKASVDEKFIKSKGIAQLTRQIELLSQLKFKFDGDLIELLQTGRRVTIYPIICFNEFTFSMPAINKYINELFKEQLDQIDLSKLKVKPVTLMTIETMFDFSFRGGRFHGLTRLIDRYWEMLKKREQLLKMHLTTENALRSKASFDEIYQSEFLPELLLTVKEASKTDLLKELIGLRQSEIDEVL